MMNPRAAIARFIRRLAVRQELHHNRHEVLHSTSRSLSSGSGDDRGLRKVVIVAAKRTPIGAFQGSLASLSAIELGSLSIRAALQDANIKPENVQELYFGNVLSSGLGQAPARQAALRSDLSVKCVCTTVNKVCASGMKAVMLGAQSIALGFNDLVVAGGMESMSNAPFLLKRNRPLKHVGEVIVADSMMKDGLWDPYKDISMGECAEICAEDMGISRDDQDNHAIRSYERAITAQAKGLFGSEIVPVILLDKRGKETRISQDEECSKFDPDKLKDLGPAFREDGTVTAGNSSSISDGAAAIVLASAEYAEKEGLPVLATIRGFGDAEQAPEKFPSSPSVAIPRALQRAHLQLGDVDLFEINEAFSVVDIANQQLLGLSPEFVNIHGGAVSLGHPIGASGTRIIMSLITGLIAHNLKLGVAAICNGGGGASSIILERGQWQQSPHDEGELRPEAEDAKVSQQENERSPQGEPNIKEGKI